MLIAEKVNVELSGRRILTDVFFRCDVGEIVVLVGPNGAGKTTLIKALNATVPIGPSGQILIGPNGRSIEQMSRREIAASIAVVAQETETRFPVTVLEFVLAGRFVYGGAFGWETEADVAAARRSLADCDLDGFEDRWMNELSGGERQRVVLARALATNARILLLDEPTANLDIAHQAMMFRLVTERCRSCGSSAIVITHDLNLAAEFADRIVMIKDGRMSAFGTPEEVLTAKKISEVFGVNALLDRNPASGSVRVTNVF